MNKTWTALCLAILAVFGTAVAGAQSTAEQTKAAKNLWIAKFECTEKAAQAVASTQQADLNALQYSSLFASVTNFTTQPKVPAGDWSLTGKELSFSGGNTAERALIGFGSGRAHLLMLYQLTDPAGKVVWTKKIKSKPSWWGSSGAVGAVQSQSAASGKQGQALVDALAKFLQNGE